MMPNSRAGGARYRGSRKHVIDWTNRAGFKDELQRLIPEVPLTVDHSSLWMPDGLSAPKEARLEMFGPRWLSGHAAWDSLPNWWLAHTRGANTPNWDIAMGCSIDAKPGLILVEAKANWPELSVAGKKRRADASQNSLENHTRIGTAIEEACRGWRAVDSRVSITRDSHYQLANRLAFTWKLATLGIPVALIYLGFTGDAGITSAGAPFEDADDWDRAFAKYTAGVFPRELLGQKLEIRGTPVWVLSPSRQVLEVSPPRARSQ